MTNKKIIIDPVTRVEGHGRVTIHLDNDGNIRETRFHIVEFRGFERFVQGRPYWEAPVLVQRLCGICPVSHHIAAAKAMDDIVGVTPDSLTPTAEKMRRLMHYGQFFQSHALHFFYLASPDLLFGFNAPTAKRNVIALAIENRELARRGIMMRKYGQEVIKRTAGKKIHGTGAIPGGINKNLSITERDELIDGLDDMKIDKMIEWAGETIEFFKDYHKKNVGLMDSFATYDSNYMSIVREDGAFDIYHGKLRAIDAGGKKIFDNIDYHDYLLYIKEAVKPWSYMKFPFIFSIGKENGWYRVGPLARLNTCDYMPTPLAQKEFEYFRAYTGGKPNRMTMHTHWARLIETLHAAEVIKELLMDPDLQKDNLYTEGKKTYRGIGVIEAPRGTLLHHYEINENDQITLCNLIVSTTNNNEAMNRAVNQVACNRLSGKKEITDEMLNEVEVAIRAFDPCLSCATHALGQMPLRVSLYDAEENLISEKIK